MIDLLAEYNTQTLAGWGNTTEALARRVESAEDNGIDRTLLFYIQVKAVIGCLAMA